MESLYEVNHSISKRRECHLSTRRNHEYQTNQKALKVSLVCNYCISSIRTRRLYLFQLFNVNLGSYFLLRNVLNPDQLIAFTLQFCESTLK